jgi:small subunit ribosomal protein S20
LPGIKSSQKQARLSEKRRWYNKSVKTQTKTNLAKAEKLILSPDLGSAQEMVTTTIRALDKAAKKGIIHPNNAARRKSRLMNKLKRAASFTEQAPPEDIT